MEQHVLLDPKNNFWPFVNEIAVYVNRRHKRHYRHRMKETDMLIYSTWSFIINENEYPFIRGELGNKRYFVNFYISEIRTKGGVILSTPADLFEFLIN